ncbi:RDD family protein [Alkalibacillus aidingensis]|uniref:RDD family protein n=1 Tax=Alkalibacillus aidingensis TaxID=2747607 RepID=UPI001660756C|nr:RDD family protein [Alkalibacillus aidingensis]
MPLEEHRPAGFWIRFLAWFIDGIFVLVLAWMIAVLINDQAYFESWQATSGEQSTLSDGIASLIYNVVFVVIFTASTLKGTPGKLICKIQVVNPDMTKISMLKSIGRLFAYIISALPLLIGFMLAGWNQEKKALHDIICRTRVVYRQ